MKNLYMFLFALLCSTVIYSQTSESILSGTLTHDKPIFDLPKNSIDLGYSPDINIKWSEGFEGITFPPAGWQVFQMDGGTNTWLRNTTTSIFGTACASVRYESSTITNNDWLASPQFLVNDGDELNFWAKQGTTGIDSFSVWFSTTGTTPPTGWAKLGSTIVPTSTPTLYTIPLNSLSGQNVYIAFRYYALNQYRLYLDSIYVVTPIPVDAGVVSLGLPSIINPGIIVPTAVIKNFGSTTQSFNVTLKIGTYTSTKTIANIGTGVTANISFDNWSPTIGNYTAKVYTQLSGDGNSLNDTLIRQIEVLNTFINGPFVTSPGGGPNGADGSLVTAGLSINGFNVSKTYFYRIADDFVVTSTAHLANVNVYIYQTGSTTVSTINFGNIRIWRGFPEYSTSSLVFGDSTTNHMTSTSWSNCYRYSSTNVGTTRPIMEVTLNCPVDLSPGTYYIDFSIGGSLASGPWACPIAIPDLTVTGNAYQRANGPHQWATLNDSVANSPIYAQGIPFRLNYTTGSITPVELKSFIANIDKNDVILTWITATEINNKGFDIERKSASGNFEKVGFVAGHGTSIEANYYSFVNKSVANGQFSYRLKQIDLDGSISYSYNVNVDINFPDVFSLEQNYPNPFNPTTAIKFSLADDSKISLRIFNILGEEVFSYFQNLKSGSHIVNFNSTSLSSGIYLYKLEARTVNGDEFTSTKKMTLLK